MNGPLLALGTVSALALGVAARRGSRSVQSRTVQFADLVENFQVLLEDLMEERWGSDDGEPASPPDALPVTLRAVEPLYRQVEHDAWDDRGPAHVAEMVRTMGRRIPVALRRDPDAVADRLLARVACFAFRGTGKPRKRISCLWMAPVVTFGGVVADGRHRLFAAHQLGITHLPSIEMDDLGSPLVGSRSQSKTLPSVLYHGTRHAFDRFDLDHPGKKDPGWLGRGVYLASSFAMANSYAMSKKGPDQPRILRLRVDLRNPRVATHVEKLDWSKMSNAESAARLSARFQEQGHDGIVLDHGANGLEVVVFDTDCVVQVAPPLILPGPAERRRYTAIVRDFRGLASTHGAAMGLWARRHGLTWIDSGADRVVFAIPEGVLKIALCGVEDRQGEEGDPERDQNCNEARVWREAPDWLRPHLVPVLAASRDGEWLVMERVAIGEERALPGDLREQMNEIGLVDLFENVSDDRQVFDYGYLEVDAWERAVFARGSRVHSDQIRR